MIEFVKKKRKTFKPHTMMWIRYLQTVTVICLCKFGDSSIPCDLLYGGCKHNLQTFISALPPPILSHQTFFHQEVYQQQQYHPQHLPQQFLPAPPGKIPRCAKPGMTFCEKIDRYPSELIQTLVAKTKHNFRSLFIDENGESFTDKLKKPGQQGFAQGSAAFNPPANNFQVTAQYRPPAQYFSGFDTLTNFSQSQRSPHEAYPNRQYPLQESATHIVDPVLYASFIEPSVDITPYNPSEWWKRKDETANEKSNKNIKKKRQTDNAAVSELCPTRSQFIMPRAALNNKGQWKYVVNVNQGNEKYTQLVRSETCLTDECSGFCSLPNGYTSKCQQKYVQKRLVSLEGSGTTLETELFWFPHCCVCQVAPDIT